MAVYRSILLASLLALSGCTDEPSVITQPPMLITSGYIKLDSGRTIQVVGYDNCSIEGDYKVVGRLDASSSRAGCVKVSPSADSFEVTVGTATGMIAERWRVAASAEAIRLVRPNGDTATVFRLVR